MKLLVMLLALALAMAGEAVAQVSTDVAGGACVAPDAPMTWEPGPALNTVVPPKCLNLEKGTTTCSKKVFDGYNAQIMAYNDQLKARIEAFNTYAKSLNAYVRAANDYSACQHAKATELMHFDK